MKQKLTKQISLLLLMLFGCGLGLGVVELFAQLTLPRTSDFEGLFIADPTLGWRGQPNSAVEIERAEFSRTFVRNARGMHDTDHPFDKPADTLRLLVLGDSFVEAMQVDEPLTAHQQLENRLRERAVAPNVELVSAGVAGWGTGQQLQYYRHEGRAYQPDGVLLLFFIGNDVQDNLPGHVLTIDGFNRFAPYFPVCADGTLDPQAWAYVPGFEAAWGACPSWRRTMLNWVDGVRRQSALVAQLEPLVLRRQPIRRLGREFDLPYTALYLPTESETVRYGWQVTEGLIRQLATEVTADGARFGVIFFGPSEIVRLSLLSEGQQAQWYRENPALREAQVDYPNRRLADFLTAQQIPHLDLQPHFRDHLRQTGTAVYFPLDRHWTVTGNRLVAETIAAWWLER